MDRRGVAAVCLALPGVSLDHPWDDGHDAYKVGGKMFAIVGSMGGISFKVSDVAFEALTEAGRARPAPYLARARWVQLENPADWPDEDLADYLREAHRLIAAKLPKRERQRLELG